MIQAIGRRAGVFVLALLAVECQDIESPDPLLSLFLPSGGGGRIGIVASDLGAAGRFILLTPEGIALPGSIPVHSDAVARVQNQRVYIINRLNRDNIQVLNPNLLYLTEAEYSVGAGSNPHDFVTISPDSGYLSRYERADILRLHPPTGALQNTISLAAYADADGLPEVSALFYSAPYLYAALQRLNRNDASGVPAPTDRSILIEIDTRSDTIVGAYNFPGCTNPFGRFSQTLLEGAPHLIIPCAGRLGFLSQLDGGVVGFNLSTRTFRPGFLYSETAAGGDILDVQIRDGQAGYVSVLDAAFNKTIQRFEPISGLRQSNLAFFPASAGFFSGLLLSPDGRLFAANANFSNPGVAIYDSGDRLQTIVPIGLRPTDMVYIP